MTKVTSIIAAANDVIINTGKSPNTNTDGIIGTKLNTTIVS